MIIWEATGGLIAFFGAIGDGSFWHHFCWLTMIFYWLTWEPFLSLLYTCIFNCYTVLTVTLLVGVSGIGH